MPASEAYPCVPSAEAGQADNPRLVMAGVSSTAICGVRDHAQVLAAALREQGASVSLRWWERDRLWGPTETTRRFGDFVAELEGSIEEDRPASILYHYTAFAHSWRGIPILVPVLHRALTRSGAAVTLFLHEFAFPWRGLGLRGLAFASSQRAALVPLVAGANRLVATTEDRAQWLRSRPWLPRREITSAPVASNLPGATGPSSTGHVSPRIGVFSFADTALRRDLIIEAVGLLSRRGLDPRLVLIGAPGRDSDQGRGWQELATRGGCLEATCFTGILDRPALARAVAGVDIIVHADRAGPTSRKTSLAAALALARPVVAVDGPLCWGELVDSQAVVLVAPTGGAVAGAVERLAMDPEQRRDQGRRGLAFYERAMSPQVTASRLVDLLGLRQSPVNGGPTR